MCPKRLTLYRKEQIIAEGTYIKDNSDHLLKI